MGGHGSAGDSAISRCAVRGKDDDDADHAVSSSRGTTSVHHTNVKQLASQAKSRLIFATSLY